MSIDELIALTAKIPKEPWQVLGDGRQVFAEIGCVAKCDTQLHDDDDPIGLGLDEERGEMVADWVAAARTALPAALRTLRHLRSFAAEMRDYVDHDVADRIDRLIDAFERGEA